MFGARPLIPTPTPKIAAVCRLAGTWALLYGRSRRHGVHVAEKQGCGPGAGDRRVPIDLLQRRGAVPIRLEDRVRLRPLGVLRRCG